MFRTHFEATSPSKLSQPWPWVGVITLTIGKHNAQHVLSEHLESKAILNCIGAPSKSNSETAALMQDHAPAISEQSKLAYPEALRSVVVTGVPGPETADCAQAQYWSSQIRIKDPTVVTDLRASRVLLSEPEGVP